MTGLLVKDFKIMTQRKTFFILMYLFSLFFAYSNDSTFGISYFVMLCTIFCSTTIGYDDADNCYPFLLALPITKRDYVLSKYLMGIIVSLSALIVSLIGVIAVSMIAGKDESLFELVCYGLVVSFIVMIMLSITIPTTIKYGQQGGLIATAGIAAAVFAGGFAFSQNILAFDMDPVGWIDNHMVLSIVILAAIWAVIYVISTMISIKIMKGKSY